MSILRATGNLIGSMLLVACASCGSAVMDVQEKTMVGNELRMIVETHRSVFPFWSHTSTNYDTKGYLIIVDLASNRPLPQRSRVYGPLWDVPDAQSEFVCTPGDDFTKNSVGPRRQLPYFEFDENGGLIRFRADLIHGQTRVDHLDLKSTTYTDLTAYKPIDSQTQPGSDDRVDSNSGRYMLLYQNNAAHLYDLYTGREKQDAWLTNLFAESRRIPFFEKVRALLTDDLNHLVISPRELWNEGFGRPKHTTFDLGAKTFSRAEYFLCADRPEANLQAIKREAYQQAMIFPPPHEAFTIDGGLMLLERTNDTIRLYRRDGTTVYQINGSSTSGWIGQIIGMSRRPSEGRLGFFTVDLNHHNWDQIMDREVVLHIWDYHRNTITRAVVPITDLFWNAGDQYLPRVKLLTPK